MVKWIIRTLSGDVIAKVPCDEAATVASLIMMETVPCDEPATATSHTKTLFESLAFGKNELIFGEKTVERYDDEIDADFRKKRKGEETKDQGEQKKGNDEEEQEKEEEEEEETKELLLVGGDSNELTGSYEMHSVDLQFTYELKLYRDGTMNYTKWFLWNYKEWESFPYDEHGLHFISYPGSWKCVADTVFLLSHGMATWSGKGAADSKGTGSNGSIKGKDGRCGGKGYVDGKGRKCNTRTKGKGEVEPGPSEVLAVHFDQHGYPELRPKNHSVLWEGTPISPSMFFKGKREGKGKGKGEM